MFLYGINNFELSWKKSLDELINIMIEFKKPKVSILNEKLITKVDQVSNFINPGNRTFKININIISID